MRAQSYEEQDKTKIHNPHLMCVCCVSIFAFPRSSSHCSRCVTNIQNPNHFINISLTIFSLSLSLHFSPTFQSMPFSVFPSTFAPCTFKADQPSPINAPNTITSNNYYIIWERHMRTRTQSSSSFPSPCCRFFFSVSNYCSAQIIQISDFAGDLAACDAYCASIKCRRGKIY